MSDKYISIPHDSGSVNISEDVIIRLVQNAVSESDGVAGFAYTAGNELAELIGLKTVQKGIKVQFVDSSIVVDAIINVKYGENIVKVAQDVQNRVRALIVSTTGIEDAQINIHVSGISFEK
jgi:uncharacterized alkaline shock family protein YloU